MTRRKRTLCPRCEERPGEEEAFPGLTGYPDLCIPCNRIVESQARLDAQADGRDAS